MANNVAHDVRASSSTSTPVSSAPENPRIYPGTVAYARVSRAEIEKLTPVSAEKVDEVNAIRESLADARSVVAGEKPASKKVIRLAQEFVRASQFYSDKVGEFIKSRIASDTFEARTNGYALNEIIAAAPQSAADREVRARAEFMIQASSSTVKSCYDYRIPAYIAYNAAAQSDPGRKAASEQSVGVPTGLLNGFRTILGLSRTL